MKNLLKLAFTTLVFIAASSSQAASDADVTLLKVQKVSIEENVIVITVAEAKTGITLIKGDHDPAYTGDQWHGMPVTRVQVISNEAAFTIKRDSNSAPDGPLARVWQESLQNAKDLQDGKEVGRIAFYAPDIVIKGNMITSITGSGFLLSKGR